jgi:hypothetical protein
MSKLLEDKAAEVVQTAYKDSKPAFAIEIFVIISIILSVIKVIQQCQAAKNIPKIAAKPTFRNRRLIKKAIREAVRAYPERYKYYDIESTNITNGILEVGKNSTVEEIEELYAEFNK